MLCYNAVIADARMPSATDLQARCSILSPELALPSGSHASTTRSHGALHILGNPFCMCVKCLQLYEYFMNVLVSYEYAHEFYNTNDDGQCGHLCFFKADVTSVVNVFPIFFIEWAFNLSAVAHHSEPCLKDFFS